MASSFAAKKFTFQVSTHYSVNNILYFYLFQNLRGFLTIYILFVNEFPRCIFLKKKCIIWASCLLCASVCLCGAHVRACVVRMCVPVWCTCVVCMCVPVWCACTCLSGAHAHACVVHMRIPVWCTCAFLCGAHACACVVHMHVPVWCACMCLSGAFIYLFSIYLYLVKTQKIASES